MTRIKKQPEPQLSKEISNQRKSDLGDCVTKKIKTELKEHEVIIEKPEPKPEEMFYYIITLKEIIVFY